MGKGARGRKGGRKADLFENDDWIDDADPRPDPVDPAAVVEPEVIDEAIRSRLADKQLEDVIGLMRWMTWRWLGGVPHCFVEDLQQDMALEFWQRLKTGRIKNPRAYSYPYVGGKCADFLNPKKDNEGFRKSRQGIVSQSTPLGSSNADNDSNSLTLLDLVYDPWDDPAALLEFGPREEYPDRKDQIEALRRAALREALEEALAGDPAGDLWRHKALGLANAQIAAAVGLRIDQVRGRLARSKPRLQKRLRKLGYGRRGKINRAECWDFETYILRGEKQRVVLGPPDGKY
jgi:DNA-directed RNA polymerase specialized sigma24 family protein